MAAWASAAKRSPVDGAGMDAPAGAGGGGGGGGRQRSATVDLGGGGFGLGRTTTATAAAAAAAAAAASAAASAAAAAAASAGGDAVLATIAAGMPAARLPLVPEPDETFVSRDTGVTGKRGLDGDCFLFFFLIAEGCLAFTCGYAYDMTL